jgi:hypothetical protein
VAPADYRRRATGKMTVHAHAGVSRPMRLQP